MINKIFIDIRTRTKPFALIKRETELFRTKTLFFSSWLRESLKQIVSSEEPRNLKRVNTSFAIPFFVENVIVQDSSVV